MAELVEVSYFDAAVIALCIAGICAAFGGSNTLGRMGLPRSHLCSHSDALPPRIVTPSSPDPIKITGLCHQSNVKGCAKTSEKATAAQLSVYGFRPRSSARSVATPWLKQ
eukprot:4273035-Amphidinium_carterae.1